MQTRTFEATWSATAHGSTVKVVYAQAPSHRYFRVGDTFVVMTSHRVSFCAVSSGCITKAIDPLQSLVGVYNGEAVLTVLRQQLLPQNRGPMRTRVSYFGESIAGLDSTCVVVSGLGHAGRWCVATPGGIVTRWRAGQYSLTLTSFSRTPQPSLFTPPTA